MASLNVSLDHSSPLIRYTEDWSQKEDGSFSWTDTKDASATATFPAKWVQIRGSRNKFHGAYTVSIDGKDYPKNGSTSDDQLVASIFDKTLAESDGGEHTMMITNNDWMTLNIDSINFTCDIGPSNTSSSAKLQTIHADQSDPSFAYSPKGTWSVTKSGLRSTSDASASVNYTFSGNAVAIFGSSGPGHAQYSVSGHPGGKMEYYDANRTFFSPRVHLYFATGFGDGNHTITLTSASSGLFEIHSAEAYSVLDLMAPSTKTVSLSSSSPSSSSSSSSTRALSPTLLPTLPPLDDVIRTTGLAAGVIAAISFAVVLVVFLLFAVWLLLRRNKRLWMRLQRGYMVQSQFDPSSPPTGVTPLIYTPPPAGTARVPPGRRGKPQYVYPTAADGDEEFEPAPLGRATTTDSQMTSSTLVAEAGSDMTQVGRNGLKPLTLATRYGSGSETTNSLTTPRDSRVSSTRHFNTPTTPSTRRHSIRESPVDYYDPYAARILGMPGLEEVPEDEVDDLLRHPIRRHEPSSDLRLYP